jgi:hypothetical protein
MLILRCAVLLAAALTLSNCCLSSSGCSGPVALTAAPAPGAAGPVAAAPAWDGLNDQAAADDDATVDVTPPKKPSRHAKATASIDAMSSQSTTGSRGKVDWAEEQAANQADDARLKRKLIICNNCSASQ